MNFRVLINVRGHRYHTDKIREQACCGVISKWTFCYSFWTLCSMIKFQQ